LALALFASLSKKTPFVHRVLLRLFCLFLLGFWRFRLRPAFLFGAVGFGTKKLIGSFEKHPTTFLTPSFFSPDFCQIWSVPQAFWGTPPKSSPLLTWEPLLTPPPPHNAPVRATLDPLGWPVGRFALFSVFCEVVLICFGSVLPIPRDCHFFAFSAPFPLPWTLVWQTKKCGKLLCQVPPSVDEEFLRAATWKFPLPFL